MANISGTPDNDTLPGTAGDDFFFGGAGVDTAQIASPSSGVIFNLDAKGRWVVSSAQGVDTLVSIEQISLNGEIVTLGRSALGITEFRVNTTTADDQMLPSVTALPDGGWTVVWNSDGQDWDGWGIYQQRYDANGLAVGGEVRVNTTTIDNQWAPRIARLADGGWLVSWSSVTQDGNIEDIYQQRYTSVGTAIGDEVRVNKTTAGIQTGSDVTPLADGGWLVSWYSSAQEVSSFDIYQQRYAGTGTAVGGEIRVNATTTGNQIYPHVTQLTDGGWLVSWTSDKNDSRGYQIYQQRYDATGAAISSEERVNTTAGQKGGNCVATLVGGGWLVCWQADGQDGNGLGIYQRRYNIDGTPIGGEARVNTTTAFDQEQASVIGLADGGWVVCWSSFRQDLPGVNGYGIYQQRFTANGVAIGGEVLVNTTTVDSQDFANVTALSEGGWLVSWSSHGQDGDGWGVYQQRYDVEGVPIGGSRVLTGDSSANTLLFAGQLAIEVDGNNGADTLQGGAGNDTLNGGAGYDWAVCKGESSNYRLSLSGNAIVLEDETFADGTDTLSGIEVLQFIDKTVIVESQAHGSYADLPVELYHFFIVAFNGAPGVTYIDQLAEAYRYGLSVPQIVEIFTTKHQFTDVYPTSLSHHDLAVELTNQIVKNSASASAKTDAANEIQAALDIGWSVGKVIYTVFGNLAHKPLSDPTWGNTARQFDNEIAVAKVYTEVLNQSTTDLDTLRDVLAPVDAFTDVSSQNVIVTLVGLALLDG